MNNRLLSRALAFLVLGLCACPPASVLTRPDDLPERVLFRTATQSYNREWYVVLREGRIWIKPNSETGKFSGDWEPLGGTGLPQGCALVRYDPPQQIREISTDGIHLMALSDEGHFYRGTNMTQDVRDWMEWHDSWGWPAAFGRGLSAEFSTERGWSVSESHPLDVGYYEDRNGTQHGTGMGVAHIYRLSPDGLRIYYNDWWLPNDWSRQICGPRRGRLPLLNISASASTMFVIAEDGSLYTRLYDFDASGESDLLTYSYLIDKEQDTTRALPLPGWRRQPDIDGEITAVISIHQSGEGNAARVLRVQGRRQSEWGLFYKNIDEESWSFEPYATSDPTVDAPFVEQGREVELAPGEDFRVQGSLGREGSQAQVEVEIVDFNIFCSPARLRLLVDGEPLSVGGEPVELALHHVHAMESEWRPRDYLQKGQKAHIRGALLVDLDDEALDQQQATEMLRELFGERQVINFQGSADRESLELTEIPFTTPFLVPQSEKGFPFALYTLTGHSDPDP